jgi:hypothetical protein
MTTRELFQMSEQTIAKGIDGSANVIAAAICAVTGNQSSSVCTWQAS